jgi:outer membrane lipopolysaccharide assembly protein LptE/RlpB
MMPRGAPAVRAIAAAALCLTTFHCGYRLRGTGSYLPANIKTIGVPMFKNNSMRFELDLRLTQAVIDELVARTKVQVQGDNSGVDAVLLGEILSFSVHPIAFTGQTTADKYNITIVVKILLRDLVNKKTLFSNPSFVYVKEYDVPDGTDFESVETEAIAKVSEEFARTIVASLLEGF